MIEPLISDLPSVTPLMDLSLNVVAHMQPTVESVLRGEDTLSLAERQ